MPFSEMTATSGSTAADVQHHGATRFVYGHARTDGGSHGLINKVYLSRAGTFGRFTDGSTFHLRGTVGHADQNTRARPEVAGLVRLSDEMLQHLLGHREIGDDAVFQGPNRRDIARRAAQHVLGLHADGLNRTATAPAGILANGHDRRFVEHDAMSPRIYKGIGGAKIDGEVIGEITQDILEHVGVGSRFRINGVI